jgi:hypothetical protein
MTFSTIPSAIKLTRNFPDPGYKHGGGAVFKKLGEFFFTNFVFSSHKCKDIYSYVLSAYTGITVPVQCFVLNTHCVHIQHLGQILSDLGFGLVYVNALSRVLSDLARPAYIGGLRRPV